MNAGRVDGCCWLAEWANWRGLHRWQLGGRTVEQINILESRLCVLWESLPWRGCRVMEKLGYSWLLWVIYLLQLLYLPGIRCMFHTVSCIRDSGIRFWLIPRQQARNAAVIIHLYYFPLWACNIYTRDALSGMLIIRKVIKCLLPWRGGEQRGAEAAARPSPGCGDTRGGQGAELGPELGPAAPRHGASSDSARGTPVVPSGVLVLPFQLTTTPKTWKHRLRVEALTQHFQAEIAGVGIESVTGEKTFWSIFLLATVMNSPFLRLPEVDGKCCSCWSALLRCWLRSGRCGSTSCCCEDELAGLMGGRPMHI